MSQLCLRFEDPTPSVGSLEVAFKTVHRRLKPRTPLPSIETEFFPYVGANHSATLEDGVLRVRVSDMFVTAPLEVLETLATILLSKIYRKKVDPQRHREYRRFTMSEEMIERSRRVRSERGRRARTTGPIGLHRNLETLFNELNARYFEGALRKPALSWTPRKARSVLGRYNYEDDVIFVTRLLDSTTVPDYVLEYILFHEMLHVKHEPRISGLREIVHTPEFREEEKQFDYYEEANDWLKEN